MLFSDVPPGPVDVMRDLNLASSRDKSLDKIDVGIGVYRNGKPEYHELKAIARAKEILHAQKADHEYNPNTGIATFVTAGMRLVFGEDSRSIKNKQVASVQAVGGTGAVRLGAAFLNRNFPQYSATGRLPNKATVHVGTPTWPNYLPLFQHAGFALKTFVHYDESTNQVDIDSTLSAIRTACGPGIFVLQVCCHNPTGLSYSRDQWVKIADAIQSASHNHFVFFDMAYQGFATGDMDIDAWPVRYFADERKIDCLVAQSFSKNMGLYSERLGILHVVCQSASIAANVKDQLRSLTRWEISSTPAYPAKLADIIMQKSELYDLWTSEVKEANVRLIEVRQALFELLTKKHRTPGSWDHILREDGLFCYARALDKFQVLRLRTEYHIYMAESGRINIAGLHRGNVERFAAAVNDVIVGKHGESGLPQGRL